MLDSHHAEAHVRMLRDRADETRACPTDAPESDQIRHEQPTPGLCLRFKNTVGVYFQPPYFQPPNSLTDEVCAFKLLQASWMKLHNLVCVTSTQNAPFHCHLHARILPNLEILGTPGSSGQVPQSQQCLESKILLESAHQGTAAKVNDAGQTQRASHQQSSEP